MNYKKIIKDNYTLHLVDTDRFKELSIAVHFSKKSSSKNIAYYNLLSKNITYSSKKYNSKNKIAIKCEELYGTKVSSFVLFTGSVESFVFNLDMLNPKYIDDNFKKESLDFFREVIFNPNVNDNHFYDEYFDIIKSDYIHSLKSIKDNSNLYSYKRFNEIYFKGTCLSKIHPSIREVNNITSSSLYEFYKQLFLGDYKIDIIVHGEDISCYEEVIDDMFKSVKGNNKRINIMINKKINNPFEEKIETLKYNQSNLFFVYKLNNINEYERKYVLKLYSTILGSMNDSMLFNYVREEYSLCYSIGATFNTYYPSIMIYAGINKNNYEEAKKRIFETMEFMKDKKKVSKLFSQAKETLNTIFNSFYDDVNSQIKYYLLCEFEDKDSIEEMRRMISNVTIDEIIELNNKLELKTIYLLKGDN